MCISPPILPGFQEALGKCANSPCLPNMLAHTAAYLEMDMHTPKYLSLTMLKSPHKKETQV